MKIKPFSVAFGCAFVCFGLSGCGGSLDGEGPPFFTTAFQCSMDHSDDGWCFSTPTRIFSSSYKLVGKGTVQDYIVSNGKVCVANANGCISINVAVKDRI